MSHGIEVQATHPNAIFSQGENSARTYTVNWSSRLDGDTISTSTWTAETTGVTIASEANTNTTASARLSGTPGRYLLTNKVTTSSGDTMETQIILQVKNNDRSLASDYQSLASYH